MQRSGLFYLKAKIKRHFFLKKLIFDDTKLKNKIKDEIMHGRIPSLTVSNSNNLVISLTSYGHRILDSLPYALWSLLHQTFQPYKICIFLSENEISNNSLPLILKRMQEAGVDFYFVEDLRSYKKLIPALQIFPNNPILTVDDDMYYGKEFVSQYWSSYLNSDKKTVLGSVGRCEVHLDNGNYAPYSQWIDSRDKNSEQYPISFYGCGGCLYPPHIFDDEIMNKEAFQRLAPTADDLWFWAMEKRGGIQRRLIKTCKKPFIPINRISLYKLEGSLTFINDSHKNNDIQLNNLIHEYNI